MKSGLLMVGAGMHPFLFLYFLTVGGVELPAVFLFSEGVRNMELNTFRHQFKRLSGVYVTDGIALMRKPLELIELSTGETIASFDSLAEALAYGVNGKTIEERIKSWAEIEFLPEFGGRGSGSGMSFSGPWNDSGDKGKDETKADLPARMNVRVGVNRTYQDMVKAFADLHAASPEEHGVVVDAQGFATKYRHGNAGSISGLTGNGSEIALHNHPKDGWPTFSRADVVNTAMGTRKGIVAISSTKGRDETTAKYAGTYSFIKGTHFNANGFVKAVGNARLSGKDYNDAVHRWLKANQKKYGYTYTYEK